MTPIPSGQYLKTPNINKISCFTSNPLTATITEYRERTGSYTTVLNSMCLFSKATRSYKHHSAPILPILPWNNVLNYISSSIIISFNPSTEAYIAKNKLKHLLIQPQDRIYYVSDRSFRSRIGVPLICGKSLLACCIVHITI